MGRWAQDMADVRAAVPDIQNGVTEYECVKITTAGSPLQEDPAVAIRKRNL